MITNIKKFIEDAKELYPDFTFDSYNDEMSIEEKFEFFKQLDLGLRERYGRGYFREKEVKFETPLDLPISSVETLIIYSLYSSESDYLDASYRAAVIENEDSPAIAVNSIIDEYFSSDSDKEGKRYITDYIYQYRIPLESAVYFCYKLQDTFKFSYFYELDEVDKSEIINIDNFKEQCKELIKRDPDAYADMCFSIYGLWTAGELAEFAKSESSEVRWNVTFDKCPVEILQELASDKCERVAEAAKEAIANI